MGNLLGIGAIAKRAFIRLREECGILASVTAFLMMATIVPDVVGRYLFNHPLVGVLEVNEIMMVVIVFFALAWTQSKRGHIRVEVLIRRLPPRAQSVLNTATLLLILALLLIIAVGGGREAFFSWSIRESSYGAVRMPIWPGRIALAFGASLMCLQLVLDIAEEVQKLITLGRHQPKSVSSPVN